jgi:riboflavin biosynthesis pyrimidine reductase
VRQIFPVQGPDLLVVPKPTADQPPPAVEELARLYSASAGPSWLQANMVASVDGAAALTGRSGGLSGPGDRMVFTVLRSLADLILVGAGTARTERYRPAQAAGLWQQLRPAGAPPPAIAVVTAKLNVDPDGPLLTGAAAGAETVVVTTTDAPPDRKAAIAKHARVVETGQHQVDMPAAVAALRGLGYHRILCEGGPALLGQLTAAGLVDELCLTTSPLIASGPAGRIVSPTGACTGVTGAGATAADGVPARLSLAHLLADESFLFCRYLTER